MSVKFEIQPKAGSGKIGHNPFDGLLFNKDRIETPTRLPLDGYPPVFSVYNPGVPNPAHALNPDRQPPYLIDPNVLFVSSLQAERVDQTARIGAAAAGLAGAWAGKRVSVEHPTAGGAAVALGLGSFVWHAFQFWQVRNMKSLSPSDLVILASRGPNVRDASQG